MDIETPQERLARLSAYGILKEAQVRSALPADLQEQLEALARRRRRSAGAERRLHQLWDTALRLHAERMATPVTAHTDLFVYADEIGARMR
jgi:hypothetical protein